MYRRRGYSTVRRDPEWVPGSAYLMTKAITPALLQCAAPPAARGGARRALGGSGSGSGAAAGLAVRGSTRGDGVFVWELAAGEEQQQQGQQEQQQ